jgi:branched-chain amino acid transport system permease protein
VGAITFLVAAGFSLILGLMDVLNLAHGEMFMLGAYVGWTVYVRPDTFVDGVTPLALLAAGLMLTPLLDAWLGRRRLAGLSGRVWPWFGLAGRLAAFLRAAAVAAGYLGSGGVC